MLRLGLHKADGIMRNGTGSDKTLLPLSYRLIFSESYAIIKPKPSRIFFPVMTIHVTTDSFKKWTLMAQAHLKNEEEL